MAKFEIKMSKETNLFVVTDITTKKSYECKFSFHQGHGDFKEFYVDVSNVPGAKLKKWFTIPTKFTFDENTKKFVPNIYELTFENDLCGNKNKYADLSNLF